MSNIYTEHGGPVRVWYFFFFLRFFWGEGVGVNWKLGESFRGGPERGSVSQTVKQTKMGEKALVFQSIRLHLWITEQYIFFTPMP